VEISQLCPLCQDGGRSHDQGIDSEPGHSECSNIGTKEHRSLATWFCIIGFTQGHLGERLDASC
jgi:hypothetical protein